MKTDRDFYNDYNFGMEWHQKVHSALHGRNPDIWIPKPHTTLIEGKVLGFADDGDIAATCLIQPKRRKIDFTCQRDYPYPTIFIDEEYKLKSDHISDADYFALPEKERLAHLKWFHSYWISNRDMTHCALVIPASKRYWTLDRHWSKPDRRWVTSWAVPKGKAVFGTVENLSSLLTWT